MIRVSLLLPAVLPAAVALAALLPTSAPDERGTGAADARIAPAARALVESMPPAVREQACLPFEDDERLNWHFIPRERRGAALRDLPDEARRHAHALMRAALSPAGYLKATTIWRLEDVLFELESRPDRPATHRDAQAYRFTVFGTPGAERWGFRLEGHHLSLNFSFVGGVARCTPFFLGANPGCVQQGPLAGLEVLAREGEAGRALLAALGGESRRRAIIAETAPADVLLIPGRDGGFEAAEGLPASAMDAVARDRLRELIELYLQNLRPDLVQDRRARVEADFEQLYFAWAGSSAPGEGCYYRVHGPGFALEYDNTQNGANHPHAVWREFEGDFAHDLLGEHLREHHPR